MSELRVWTEGSNRRAMGSPPYEVLGWLLEQDVSLVSANEYLDFVAQAKRGELHTPFSGVGNANYLEIRGDRVLIRSEFADPPSECRLELGEFEAALMAWRTLILEGRASVVALGGT